MSDDLNLLKLFAVVADAGSFRAATDRLGVTRPAISQGIRRLEEALGKPLFKRTTRSVHLTEFGARFLASIGEPLEEIQAAMQDARQDDDAPHGLLRVAVTSIAERFLSGPLIASFAKAYPEVVLDVTVTDAEFDIVASGFDAGVRLGEVIEADMVAVPLTGEQRQVAVAAPDYVARYGMPAHPEDLTAHLCIGWRPRPDVAPYRWEFERDGRNISVAVAPRVTTNDMLLMIRTALAGAGITFGMEETFRPYIDRGELVTLLDDWLPPFAEFYLYFPSRRTVEPKLRALIDHVRASRRGVADALAEG